MFENTLLQVTVLHLKCYLLFLLKYYQQYLLNISKVKAPNYAEVVYLVYLVTLHHMCVNVLGSRCH